jgi:hypothetical protein
MKVLAILTLKPVVRLETSRRGCFRRSSWSCGRLRIGRSFSRANIGDVD